MASRSSYPQEYVDSSREAMRATVAAYEELRDAWGDTGSALASFEPLFFRQMVLALDGYFADRADAPNSDGAGGSDSGSPLSEVRDLCTSITSGEEVVMDADEFRRLAEAFFTAIEREHP